MILSIPAELLEFLILLGVPDLGYHDTVRPVRVSFRLFPGCEFPKFLF
ncbi:MAG: hypothetical protein NT056_08115 [Proteobacteria bacterium]|nr:hypothetical protein [Pseudomonadota bacterium]